MATIEYSKVLPGLSHVYPGTVSDALLTRAKGDILSEHNARTGEALKARDVFWRVSPYTAADDGTETDFVIIEAVREMEAE